MIYFNLNMCHGTQLVSPHSCYWPCHNSLFVTPKQITSKPITSQTISRIPISRILVALILTLLLLPILSSAQILDDPRDDPKDPKEPPRTGSGAIFGDGILRYSTYQYHSEAIKLTKEQRATIKEMEQYVHNHRRYRLDQDELINSLVFHNNSRMDQGTFSSEVAIQLSALQRDFSTDPKTFAQLFRNTERIEPVVVFDAQGQERYQLLKFESLGGEFDPNPIIWKDWTSIDARGEEDSQIDIHVVDDLPDELGHGYAKHIWIDDPESTDIVIRAESFGSGSGDFKGGKVLIFLISNYLGLGSLYTDATCMDDGILTTPIHNAPVNFCWDDQPPPTSLCDNQPILFNNYMSHSPDDCKTDPSKGFTPNQWRRIYLIKEYLAKNK